MQTRTFRLVEKSLDLESPPADAVRFVPMDFGPAERAVAKPDRRFTLELAPPTFAMCFLELGELSNPAARCNHRDPDDAAHDLDTHAPAIVGLVPYSRKLLGASRICTLWRST